MAWLEAVPRQAVDWLDLKTRKEGGCGWLDVEFEEDFGESGGGDDGWMGHLPKS